MTQTDAPAPQAVIIYNPAKVDVDDMMASVGRAAQRHGWPAVEYVETTPEDPGVQQARDAVAAGATMVVACGGDGTVRAVASALRGTDAALGILPAGTGNLLARNLKLPLSMEESIEVAFGGHDERMDICTATVTRPDGESNDIDFVVMAGVGIDAQMIINTDDTLKEKIGFFAYAIGVVKSLRGGNRIKIMHQMDDHDEERVNVHSVIVGNCGELMGNIALLPDAKADDGILDVVAMRPKGVWGWAQIAGRLVRQMAQKLLYKIRGSSQRVTSNNNLDSLRYVKGKNFRVSLREPELFEVDGDEVGMVTAFHATVHHLALKIRVADPAPREHPGEPTADVDVVPGLGVEESNKKASGKE